MLLIFKNKTYFTFLFSLILMLDIYVKSNLEAVPYRLFSKPLVMLSLIFFYLINNNEGSKKKFKFMLTALIAFLIGDLFLIFENTYLYISGLLFFIIAKLNYVARFSNQRDFNLVKLVPFLIACFFYMAFIMFFVLNNLKSFFIPAMLYLFATMIVALFAILRKGAVSKRSFNLVMVGIFLGIICDSISLFQSFYDENFFYHKITVMLTYGLSQYFIISGILVENKKITV